MPNFESRNIIMSARIYLMKRIKDCLKWIRKMNSEDGQVYYVCKL